MTPIFFCISGTSNSLSACSKNLNKFYRVENFRANVLKLSTEICSACLSILKHASADYATNAFSSKEKCEKLAVVVHVPYKTQNLVISRCCFREEGKEIYRDL